MIEKNLLITFVNWRKLGLSKFEILDLGTGHFVGPYIYICMFRDGQIGLLN